MVSLAREGAMTSFMFSAFVSGSRGPGSSHSQLSQISYKSIVDGIIIIKL